MGLCGEDKWVRNSYLNINSNSETRLGRVIVNDRHRKYFTSFIVCRVESRPKWQASNKKLAKANETNKHSDRPASGAADRARSNRLIVGVAIVHVKQRVRHCNFTAVTGGFLRLELACGPFTMCDC